MNTDNITNVVDNELCFGCGTCLAICPSDAIRMKFSPLGRLLPDVKNDACTHCGLCQKVCPGIDLSGDLSEALDASLMGHVESLSFAKSTDKSIFDNAQSGGAVTSTLSYLFESKLIDAALVVHQVQHEAKFKVVTRIEELLQCQSSQYTPVDLNSGLRDIANYEHAAIVGLPCHIEGIVKLKKTFPNRFNNIAYLLGLVCAGTLAQSCVEVTKRIGEPKIGKIAEDDTIYWRLKKYSNYDRADIAIVGPDGNARILDNNIRHICKHHLTAPRCKLCFDKMNLYSDIVFGDCWGLTGEDTKGGGNIIISRTTKGSEVIAKMCESGLLVSRPCSIDEVSKGQGIHKKKRTVEKVLAIYQQRSLLTPGWAKSAIFSKEESIDKSQSKEIDCFIKRDKLPSEVALKEVTSKVKTKLVFKKFTAKVRKAIGYKKNS